MEYRLYRSWSKSLALLFGAGVFVAIPFIVARKEPVPLLIWVGAAFFGLAFFVILFGLLDRRPQVRLDGNGILDRSWKQGPVPWEAIQGAYSYSVYGAMFVALLLDEEFLAGRKLWDWKVKGDKSLGGQAVNINLTHVEVDANKLCTAVQLLARIPKEDRELLLAALADEPNRMS